MRKLIPIEGEVWLPVVGYEQYYLISDHGRLFSLIQNRPLKTTANVRGYIGTSLNIIKTRKSAMVHRLVAIAFIPNPDNKKEVNHIDGNKLNNHISNLEWVTPKENVEHMWRTGLNSLEKMRKAIDASKLVRGMIILDSQTGVYYDTIIQASKWNDISKKRIARMIKKRKRFIRS
jgi:hypothetical protein